MNLNQQVAEWLSRNGFSTESIASTNAAGQYPLILAAQQAEIEVLQWLLANGADLTVLDLYGNNALWAACFAESIDCIELLLNAGIDPDYRNPSGATALIYSSSSGKAAMVAKLLQMGANPLLTTQDDFSALDLAATRECLYLLRNAVKAIG
ncbi:MULTISPECIES: ankyrin repeat domain-containing protein [Methylomonas]|uniref:ankyrin repeat domain-containing protein n=1 Tax=Methylomonas TaxID=416 RepID=UPI00123186E3|nr:ankyrin repeat domain-containing protein [Methylomonas rhizoryzae]